MMPASQPASSTEATPEFHLNFRALIHNIFWQTKCLQKTSVVISWRPAGSARVTSVRMSEATGLDY